MKKFVFIALVLIAGMTILESCSSKLCPAYSSYPQARGRR